MINRCIIESKKDEVEEDNYLKTFLPFFIFFEEILFNLRYIYM
jgi:hypothetical protein